MYKFKSKATGDLIMLTPNGDALLRALGREPSATGIIEPVAMDAAVAAIERAIADDEAERARAEQEAAAEGHKLPPRGDITPRQRFVPMIDMLRRAQAAGEPITWGV